jgi:hypothetical protein
MNRTQAALVRGSVAGCALLLIQAAGSYSLAAFGLAERLFSGGVTGGVAAVLVLAVVSSRILLAFVLPGYVLAVATIWFLAWRWPNLAAPLPSRDASRRSPA